MNSFYLQEISKAGCELSQYESNTEEYWLFNEDC